jgi:hypothetical protein
LKLPEQHFHCPVQDREAVWVFAPTGRRHQLDRLGELEGVLVDLRAERAFKPAPDFLPQADVMLLGRGTEALIEVAGQREFELLEISGWSRGVVPLVSARSVSGARLREHAPSHAPAGVACTTILLHDRYIRENITQASNPPWHRPQRNLS